MQFTPKTDQQIEEERHKATLWAAGEYPFEVIEQVSFGQTHIFTMDTISKKNQKDMLQLVVKIYNYDGAFITVVDYLVEAMAFKLKHVAEACGLLSKYETGQMFATDFIGKKGVCKLEVQKGKKKDDGSFYPDKNVITDYVVEKNTKTTGQSIDDEIPF